MTSLSTNCLRQHHRDLEMVRDTTTKESLTIIMDHHVYTMQENHSIKVSATNVQLMCWVT